MKLRYLLTPLAALSLATPAQAQLVRHWDFSTSANDIVGGAVGTLNGGATVSGGVLSLDGSTGFVQFGSHLVPTSGNYTIALFMRAVGSQGGIAEFISQGTSGGPGFYIGSDGGNGLRATDSWYHPSGSTGFNQDGQFHHYALTVSASSNDAWFYIDGALVGQRGGAISTTTGGSDTRFGKQFDSHGEFTHGELDDIRFYANTLSASEIEALSDYAAVVTPEPASLVLLGTGFAAIAFVRRRKS